jgi:excisionase family DNA binding protein
MEPSNPIDPIADRERLITLTRAASLTQLNYRTILSWVHNRRLEAVRIGKSWLTTEEALKAAIWTTTDSALERGVTGSPGGRDLTRDQDAYLDAVLGQEAD